MLSFDSDSDSEDGKSWISLKSLKEAADIKTLYRKPGHSKVGAQSPNTSVTMECLPHTTTNQSISFSYLHEQYRTSAEDYFQGVELPSIKLDTSFGEEPAPSLQREFDILKSENSIHRSRRKANNEPTARMREELAELRAQLQLAQQEIDRLRKEMGKRQQAYAIQLQELQEHHEKKQQKIRSELQLLGGVDTTAMQRREIESLKNWYEEKMEDMRVEHELELQAKEEQCEETLENLRTAADEQKHFYETMLEHCKLQASPDLQQTITEQAAIISEQARTITELRHLSSLRKSRSPLHSSNKENLSFDSELRGMIKQINSHLDCAELGGSDKSLSSSLADLRNRMSVLTGAR